MIDLITPWPKSIPHNTQRMIHNHRKWQPICTIWPCRREIHVCINSVYIYIFLWISTSHIIPIKVSKNDRLSRTLHRRNRSESRGEATGGHLIYCSYRNIASGPLRSAWQTKFYFESAHLSPSIFTFWKRS